MTDSYELRDDSHPSGPPSPWPKASESPASESTLKPLWSVPEAEQATQAASHSEAVPASASPDDSSDTYDLSPDEEPEVVSPLAGGRGSASNPLGLPDGRDMSPQDRLVERYKAEAREKLKDWSSSDVALYSGGAALGVGAIVIGFRILRVVLESFASMGP